MGEMCRHYITMLVCNEQENAIRDLFQLKNWTCFIHAVPDETVLEIYGRGYTDVFPVNPKYQGSGSGDATSIETKLAIYTDRDLCDVKVDLKIPTETFAFENKSEFSNNNSASHDNKPEEPNVDAKNSDNIPEFIGKEEAGACSENDKNNCILGGNVTSDEDSCKEKLRSDNIGSGDIDNRNRSPRTGSDKRNSKSKKKLKCSLCDMYLASKPSLLRHCQRKHEDEWFEFKCRDCPCMFKKVEELWQHRNEVKHKPPKEQPKFSEKKNLSPEELEKLGHLKCNACGKILPSRRLLRRHFYSDHREWMPDPICAVCGAEFKTRQELWKHKREMKHNDSLTLLQTYQCDECGKVLTGGYYSFKLHQKYACNDAETEPQAKCDICGSMFKSQTHVQQHKQRTHVESPVVCDICGTMCKNKHALNSHKRRHDERNKKFGCVECGKAFLTGLLLKMHVRTHTKEKPFKCPLCNYRCAIKQNIQKHSLNIHKTQVKCADIVIVRETELQDSTSHASAINDNEFSRGNESGSTSNCANLKKDFVSGQVSNGEILMSNEILPQETFHSQNRDLTKKSVSPQGVAKDKQFQNNERAFQSNNKKRQFGNSDLHLDYHINVSQFPVLEAPGPYNLTIHRQSDVACSDGAEKGPESFPAPVNTDTGSSAGSYMEMMNCSLAPIHYSHTGVNPYHAEFK